ncbi:MAG TPA: NEL-type E3 ubiquitin ligase domain-containing protein [Pseudomonas sp.]|nr:NEL-type E3 ubiquitin ligase domain-containing protein [Pseudomonas sp.]
MQPKTPKPAPTAVPMTAAQRLEALLEHTGDLDKAQVLQASIPEWLATEDLKTVQALKAAFEESFLAQAKAKTALERLKPLDEFCKEELTRFFKAKWTFNFDVERDTLDLFQKEYSSTGMFPLGFKVNVDIISRSLLQAGMENFTAAEARSGGMAAGSVIRVAGKARSGAEATPEKFAALCRELDLGARYQRHIDEALALPAKPVQGEGGPVEGPASAADIRRLKVLDLLVALHMAYLKKDITQAVYTMLLSVIEQDVPAAQTKGALFDGRPVLWQGLTIHGISLSGVLVFTKVSIDTDSKARCVVYMPNEPRRPLYEYASLDEFKTYLTLKLQTPQYRKSFANQYLQGHDKTGFFTAFDKDKVLGTLAAASADTCPGDFLFSAFVEKNQEDARVLAIPTSDVDAQQREKTIELLLDGGLLLLNAAAFFVPVIGQAMLVAAVVDIVSEVYEGVSDWTHGERHEALTHLLNVVENLAQLAAFAAGGKIISTVVSKGVKEQAAFFDGFEAITRADGKARLWKPDLEPYKQTRTLPADLQPDSEGIYRHAGQTSIVMDDAPYEVTRNTEQSPWTLNHPLRTDAFQPAVERGVEGGWRHVYEHAHEWRDGAYALRRTVPRLSRLGSDLEAVAEITDVTPDKLHHLHESNLGLPQRIKDCAERFAIDRRISEMIEAMKRGEATNTDFVQEQLHTLPRLPGWPEERFIEVLDEKDQVVSRFPETAPRDDDDKSVHVRQADLDSGDLLDTVISGLYKREVEDIIGSSTTVSKAQLLAKKIATSLESNRQPLFEWLYKTWDGTGTGDVATLRELATDLPVRMSEELLDSASGRDRSFLYDRKVLGVELSGQVHEAQATLRQDRALTGLHQPRLANADTEKLTLGLMDRLQGWDEGFRLEVRQGSVTGTLLDSVGEAQAQSRGVIVKTSTGYQVTQNPGNGSSTLTRDTLIEAILDALPATRRGRMGFTGEGTLDVATLRSRLLTAATGDTARTRRILRGERSETPNPLSACIQADPPATSPHARGLIRKVKKLYPLFDDDRISTFLDNAGSTPIQRVERVKALELQLKKLRQALHTWRDDEVQMKKLPGRLKDIRINRRQVAKDIENCWRRVTRHDQPSTTLVLARRPVGPLPTLTEQDVAHVLHLSIKDMRAGDELAYFLKPFKGLVTLELDRNQLTRLPEVLSHMPDLRHLRLDGNQIKLTEHTLRKLADMRHLITLGLSGNHLGATVDVSKMTKLRSLFLDGTHTTELPGGLFSSPSMDNVNLQDNQIRELPDWLFQVPNRFAATLNLSDNPLSVASQTKLESFRDNTGIGMGFFDNRDMLVSEQRARDLWMPKPVEQTYASRNRAWLALRNEPDADKFFELLRELASSADNRFVHEDMTRRVWGVIEAMQTDAVLCAQLLSMMERANCADAAATIFSNLEVTVALDRVLRLSVNAHDQAARLLELGRHMFRLDKLNAIARDHARARNPLEAVEVELAYRVGLAERLELFGQPQHMRFTSSSRVAPADLDNAFKKVLEAEASPELSTYLGSCPFWRDFLREHHGRQFTDLNAPFHARLETAAENDPTSGADYRAEVDRIVAEQNTAETALLKRLTEAAMEAEKSGACFALD